MSAPTESLTRPEAATDDAKPCHDAIRATIAVMSRDFLISTMREALGFTLEETLGPPEEYPANVEARVREILAGRP